MSVQRNSRVLLLNATFEPLCFVSLNRAIVLVLKNKAEIIEQVEGLDSRLTVRAEKTSLPFPSVIRLVSYIRLPYRAHIPLTRRSLLARDNHTCQYCGNTDRNLTLDHVVPRSRGGRTEWTNIVAACGPCNRKKGNKLSAEAHMWPRNTPTRPAFSSIVLLGQARDNAVWQRYILQTAPAAA